MPSGARTRAFRDLPEPGCHVVPAVYDALSARVAERGLAVAPSGWGACGPPPAGSPPPDVGQLTRTPMADHLRRMTDAVSISRSWPTVDTGDGNPLSVRRPVQVYEAARAQASSWRTRSGPKSPTPFPGARRVIPMSLHQQRSSRPGATPAPSASHERRLPVAWAWKRCSGHAEGLGPHGRRRQLPGGPPGRSRVPGRSPGPSRRPPSPKFPCRPAG